MQTTSARANTILREAYGTDAQFRPGQLEAIEAVLAGQDSLVVQKTGWGKSLVYFIATKILREDGAGPTLVISPLLALMDNQIASAALLGVNAVTINSSNSDSWDDIYANLEAIDALIVSPERLSNERFMSNLSKLQNIRLIVVDEAHSISDWGHDFRPDYQRVSKLISGLPGNVTVLGTTATANDRVIADVKAQMGNDLNVVRGDLIRENLAIQVNPTQTREQRLAWLKQVLCGGGPLSTGQGIIYCLTHADCGIVATFLSNEGVSILPYYSGMGADEFGNSIDEQNLRSFAEGKARVLAATVKLGMGYDKSDIRFVVHFQLPSNLIEYYQQIGRAGRDGKRAYAILLHGQEDEEILNYFIRTAQASPSLLSNIVDMAQDGARLFEMAERLNAKQGKVQEALKYLMVNDYIYKDGTTYRANVGKTFDAGSAKIRHDQINTSRVSEHSALLDYLEAQDCFMSRIAAELDAPDAQETCGLCSNCRGGFLIPVSVDQQTMVAATQYLRSRHGIISPRQRKGSGGSIPSELRMQEGWVLSEDYYSEAGQKIAKEKYDSEIFSAETVEAASKFLKDKIDSEAVDCVVPIPSRNHPGLVPNLAKQLAKSLGLPFAEAVIKKCDSREQKSLQNSALQEKNISDSTAVVNEGSIEGKTILLVDHGVTFLGIRSNPGDEAGRQAGR